MEQQEHIYTPASTDIEIRWRKLYNWVRPSEMPEYIAKWKAIRELAAKDIHDLEATK